MASVTPVGGSNPQIAHLKRSQTVRNPGELPALLVSFKRHLRAANKRPSTIDQYIGASLNYYAYATANGLPPPEKAKREHIETWMVDLLDHYAQHSVRNRYVGFRMFVRWLVAEGEIARDPTERIPLPTVDQVDKDVATKAQVKAALSELEKTKNWRDAAIVGVFYDTGMRASEVARATRADANLEEGVLTILGGNAKGRRPRIVALSPQAVRLLDRYLRKRTDAHEALFVGKRGPMTRSGLYEVVRDAFLAIGVTATIGPHDVRHTSASHAARALSESEMMALYGWQDADMARHYTRHVQQENAIEAHRKASPLENL